MALDSITADTHIRVNILADRLPHKLRGLLLQISDILSLIIIAVMVYYSCKFVMSSYEWQAVSQSELAVPLYVVQLVVPIGLALAGFALAIKVVRRFVTSGP